VVSTLCHRKTDNSPYRVDEQFERMDKSLETQCSFAETTCMLYSAASCQEAPYASGARHAPQRRPGIATSRGIADANRSSVARKALHKRGARSVCPAISCRSAAGQSRQQRLFCLQPAW
jgi:hypothetical protein